MRILILGLLILSGCATTAKFESNLQSWVGQPIDDVIRKNGPPESTFKLNNGNTLYTWGEVGGTQSSSTYNQFTRSVDTTQAVYSCSYSFEVDPLTIVKGYRYSGNMCRSR